MNAIPGPVQTVLDLYATTLADARFGDIDHKKLASVATDVESAAATVAAAQSALDAAKLTLQERQEVLLQNAQRALAYARVFAESDEALSAKLDAIALPRAARRVRPTEPEVLVLSAAPQPRPKRARKATDAASFDVDPEGHTNSAGHDGSSRDRPAPSELLSTGRAGAPHVRDAPDAIAAE